MNENVCDSMEIVRSTVAYKNEKVLGRYAIVRARVDFPAIFKRVLLYVRYLAFFLSVVFSQFSIS